MLHSVKVRDFMTGRLITFRPDTDLFTAIRSLLANNISGAPVVDENGQLVGLLSEMDCLQHLLNGAYNDRSSLGGARVAEIMTTAVETIDADADIITVTERFIGDRRRRFPVVEEGRLIGQISRRDVLRAVQELVSSRP